MGHTQQQTCLPSLSLPSKRPGSPPAKHDRALQGGSLLHRPRDLHRILPLLPYLQLLRCCLPHARSSRVSSTPTSAPQPSSATPQLAMLNDAYRYMDWLLTVPLLLIEIVLVMKLSPEE